MSKTKAPAKSPARLTGELIKRPSERALPHDNDNRARRGGRRDLVLTDESAGHRFRAILPPRVKADLLDIPAESLWRLTVDDVRGFASVYFAATAAILVFIL